MTEYIELTIRDVTRHIAKLQDLIQYLRDLGEAAPEPSLQSAEVQLKRRSPVKAPGQKQLRGNAEKIISVGALLAIPFRIVELERKAQIPKSSAGSTVTRWLKRGWVEKIGFGEYRRTAAFPNGAPADSPIPVSQPKKRSGLAKAILDEADKVDLENKLAAALKQRDHARENGRDQIEEMYQKEIDTLEAKLGKS